MRLITSLLLLMSVNAFAQVQGWTEPRGTLENPSHGSYTSGIYMFSGWVCDADVVEIVIDGGSGLKAGYGTNRDDTVGVCGDRDNGYGLLFNMSTLGTGEHTAVAFADGHNIGESTFFVQQLSTGEFLRGASSIAIDNNFPTKYREVILEWTQSSQNFAIAYEGPSPDPYEIEGIWRSAANDYVVSIATRRVFLDRVEIYAADTSYDHTSDVVGGASEGYVVGDTATWFSVLPEGIESQSTMTLTDSLNALVTVDSCVSYDPNLVCAYQEGETIAVRKLAGPNTARAAPQDGTPLVPIGGLGEDDLSKE